MGLEALSRGFNDVLVFEKNPKSSTNNQKNYAALGLTPNLKIGDSLKLIQKLDKNYDVIYIDPPYMSGIYENTFDKIKSDAIIIAEHSEDIDTSSLTLIKEKKLRRQKSIFS